MNIKWYLGYLFSYHKFIFQEIDFSKALPCELDKNYKFEKFNKIDTKQMEVSLQEMEIKREFDIPVLLERLEKGHLLYVAKKSSNIIGYSWIATNLYKPPYFSIDIPLNDDELYSYNAYVHRNFRGRNLINQIKAFAFNDLYKKGYKRSFSGFFSWNKASERAHIKLGSSSNGTIRYGYFFTFRYWFISVKKIQIVNNENVFILWRKIPSIIHKIINLIPYRSDKR